MSGQLFIGVDGGGTKTQFVACTVHNNELTVVTELTLGGSNHNSVGKDVAKQLLLTGLTQLIEQCNSTNNQAYTLYSIVAITCVMSGCNNDNDAIMIKQWLMEQLHSNTILSAYNDSYGALYSANVFNKGIVSIAGTGMITLGINVTNKHICGGSGCPIDDGSGYAIGIDVIRAILNSDSGMCEPTSMTNDALTRISLHSVDQIVDWLYTGKNIHNWFTIAQLAPVATIHADRKDTVAYNIVQKHCQYLAKSIVTVFNKLQMDLSTPIVLSGGLYSSDLIRSIVHQTLHTMLNTQVNITKPQISAALGAAKHAYTTYQRTSTQQNV